MSKVAVNGLRHNRRQWQKTYTIVAAVVAVVVVAVVAVAAVAVVAVAVVAVAVVAVVADCKTWSVD